MIEVTLDKALPGVPNIMTVDNSAFGGGGEGDIYLSTDRQFAIKLYHRGRTDASKRQFLERIMDIGRSLGDEGKFLCWPKGTIKRFNNQESIGCVMKFYSQPPFSELVNWVLTLKDLHNQCKSDRQAWVKHLQIARGIARSVAVLHGKGCSHTDIHYRNFLINPDTSEVVMLDLDGLIIPGWTESKLGGLLGFVAPERVIDPKNTVHNEKTDRHSLAVLLLHTLLFRNPMQSLICHDPDDDINDDRISYGTEALFSEHPNDFRNRPKNIGLPVMHGGVLSYKILSPPLQKLAAQALITGLRRPEDRPLAREWIDALSWALDALWKCTKCQIDILYPYWQQQRKRFCPICGQHFAMNMPMILRLYEPRNKGNYQATDHHLVVGNGWKVFADMLDPTRKIPMSRKNEKIVGHVEYNRVSGLYQLVNEVGGRWCVRQSDGQEISAGSGESLPLQLRSTVFFGEGCRLCCVME